MEYEIYRYSFGVPLTHYQWIRLQKLDYFQFNDRLERLGATDLEYNGHFGRALYFNAETKEQADAALIVIAEILNSPIRSRRRAKE